MFSILSQLERLQQFLSIVDTKPAMSIVFLAFNGWILLFFVCFGLSWIVFAPFRRLDLIHRSDWSSRIVSTINAVMGCLVFAKLVFGEEQLYRTGVFSYSAASCGLWKLILGYFFYDSLLIVLVFDVYEAINIQTIIHHIVVASAVIYCLSSRDPLAMLWASALFITEASTPLVNLRWFLSESNLKHTRIYIVVGLLMTLVFFIARILFMPYTVYLLLSNPNILNHLSTYRAFCDGIVGGSVFVSIYVLNIYWFYLMMRGLYHIARQWLPNRSKEELQDKNNHSVKN
ncbi:hypothetical protein GpartN1_g1082.t1 [Galdieria partita]|uniref:TLC domain-containing protein n=1 Tax=Galdieria partita TaxID=83374 RepID=A0A9C7PRW1_9RHOD|nr:hypothetical protein GpartN1_g1082.t1 [Galdieria partita]